MFRFLKPVTLPIVVILLLVSLRNSLASDALPAASIADALFPESVAWPRVNDLPSATEPDLSHLARFPSDQCFRDAIRAGAEFEENLHAADIFGEGDDDLIYTGPEFCSEGNFTAIWRHVHSPDRTTYIESSFSIIRIEKATTPRFTAWDAGCCGAMPSDDYFLSTDLSIDGLPTGAICSLNLLEIPEKSIAVNRVFISKSDSILSWTPRIIDGDDEDTKSYINFLEDNGAGTKVRIFPSGTEFQVLREYRDDAGQLWLLAMIPRNVSGHKYGELTVNVGWVRG